MVSQVTATNTYYYLSDGLGSTMKTVDGAGTVVNSYTYDVYGKVTSSSGGQANEFGFAGEQGDASTGLQYLRARYYDPATGRFISRDPMASLPGWGDNPFGYAGANPVNFTDPSGLAVVWSEAHQKWMDDANGALWTEATGWYDPKNGASWTAASGWVDPNSGMVWVNEASGRSRSQCDGADMSFSDGDTPSGPGTGLGGGCLNYGGGGGGGGRWTIQANAAQGRAGEAVTKTAIVDTGARVTSQVTFQAPNGVRARFDFVVQGGPYHGVVEVKTGLLGRFTPNQIIVRRALANGTAIPVGARAAEAGLRVGVPGPLPFTLVGIP